MIRINHSMYTFILPSKMESFTSSTFFGIHSALILMRNT